MFRNSQQKQIRSADINIDQFICWLNKQQCYAVENTVINLHISAVIRSIENRVLTRNLGFPKEPSFIN